FALDLRPGDTFTVLYEERYVDGQKIGNGDIVAAEFSNGGKTYKATLYRDSSGRKSYYAPDGTSMRKAFLRDPVHFSYISSGFNPHRMHPIFHRIMPHWGVDLVAKKGTPVRATGDGRVAIARQNSASGRYIVLRHGREYTTKYLHLSRFARGIRPGKIVKQGQVIGYVGQSGWATAPHLHYEFLVDGVHRNPRTVPLPKAAPIDGRELSRFHAVTGPLLARLDSVSGTTGYAYAAQAAKGAAVK
ncbi:MAG TPA: peptidoglycan DD-metalloendopeptidase family protein, partial [Pseudomonadales bacterium]|nr:peptidoglycan DD-metalloendopeptidase family protein [Pseudomonadales bacterium]